MKDVVISAFIFAALCALFVFNAFTVTRYADSVSEKLEYVKEALESNDTAAARQSFKEASGEWENQKEKMLYIYHHSQIEQIDRAIFSAGRYLSQGEYPEALFKMAEAQFLINDLVNHEKITLDNIF